MSFSVGCRGSLDPTLLWLWLRPAATTPIRPLAWELPYAMGATQEMAKRQKKTKKRGSPDVMLVEAEDFKYKAGVVTAVAWFQIQARQCQHSPRGTKKKRGNK